AGAVRAVQPAVRAAHAPQDKVGGASGRRGVLRLFQDLRGLGERGDHQTVPRGQALLVAPRPDAPAAHLEEFSLRLAELAAQLLDTEFEQARLLLVGARTVQDVMTFPVALGSNVINGAEHVGQFPAQDLLDLRDGPDEELALLALAVGVLGAVERPFGTG